jgi:mRNA interferase MazF
MFSCKKGEGGPRKDSVVQCNLIRAIDERRIVEKLGRLTDGTMTKVNEALKISLAL